MSNDSLIDLLGSDEPEEDLSGYPIWMRNSLATRHFFDKDLAFRVKCYEARGSKENQQVIIREAEHIFNTP